MVSEMTPPLLGDYSSKSDNILQQELDRSTMVLEKKGAMGGAHSSENSKIPHNQQDTSYK